MQRKLIQRLRHFLLKNLWRTKTRRVISILLLGLILVIFLTHRQTASHNVSTNTRIVLSSDDVAAVKTEDFTVRVPISGELYPLDQTTVIAKVSAETEKVFVREGQEVKKGDTLAQLNTADLEQTLQEKRAALTSAEASYKFSVESVKRYKKLLDNKYYSQNDYELALNQLAVNQANVKQTKAALAEATLQLQYAHIVSSLDGIVSERDIDPGMNVSVGQTLFKVVNLDQLEWRAIVPADQIGRITINQTATFEVDGMPHSFIGKVVRINPSNVAGTRAYYAYIDVENKDNLLKNGMFATGGIILEKQDGTITIPLQAVRYENKDSIKNPYVYKVIKEKIQKQPVTLGLIDIATNKAQILSGLQAGDLVITSEIEIKEGSLVMLPVGTLERI